MGISELCGLMPVATAILAARSLGFDNLKILKYANSGDTSGEKGRVVGYVSAAFYKKTDHAGANVSAGQPKPTAALDAGGNNTIKGGGGNRMLNETQRKRLLEIAREAITSYVRDGRRASFEEDDPVLNRNMGAFVTLHERGELRGCIGNMVGSGPLYRTVSDMAVEAATGDPRFQRLSPQEIGNIHIEISVLSPLKKVSSYKDVRIPGDGVIIRSGFRSGVYLPQVAEETGWDKIQFLTSLCAHKAGLSPDAWKDPATEIYVFTAEVFAEKGEK
jgi:AmmeMemoRadiSam system protein A